LAAKKVLSWACYLVVLLGFVWVGWTANHLVEMKEVHLVDWTVRKMVDLMAEHLVAL
jgi:hypothetical protein